MTAIWQNDGTGWRLLAPTGFPDEQTLHSLVEEAPQILPLAGFEAPRWCLKPEGERRPKGAAPPTESRR